MRRFAKKKTIPCLIVMLVIGIIGSFYLAQHLRKAPQATSVAPVVAPLTASEFQAESTKLSDLMQNSGMDAVFSYVENAITNNPSFAKSCHPVLHKLGNMAYKHYGSYAAAIQYQNEICNSGYTHGVLEAYLSTTPDIDQALKTACNPTVESFHEWQCFHGLGHGIMFVTLDDVQKSIDRCNTALPSAFSRAACINGVFMQHFIVVDHQGNVPKTNPTSLNDCASQQPAYKNDCYSYAPTAYLTVSDGEYMSALKWCNGAEPAYVAGCISGVGSETMKENINKVETVKKVCEEADKTFVSACISGAVIMHIFFHGSSSSAQQLCENQFKDHYGICTQTIEDSRNSFHI
jgi:hypothetical protein